MSFITLSHDLSVRARNVLEPAVLTTQRFPTSRCNQYFVNVAQWRKSAW